RVWDATTGKPVTAVLQHSSGLSHVAFGPDSRRLVVTGFGGAAWVWGAERGGLVAPPLYPGGSGYFRAHYVGLGRDDRFLVTPWGDLGVAVWDLDGHGSVVFQKGIAGRGSDNLVQFSPDGNTLLTAGQRQPVQAWNLSTGRAVRWDPGGNVAHL